MRIETRTPPRVSIVLPTYNRAAMLPDAFAAIAGQTFRRWELIVVDDGSDDDTALRVRDFSRQVERPVRYYRQANAGAYAARAAGIGRAKGEFIACYDSDDLWLPDHLQALWDSFERVPEAGWACTAAVALTMDDDGSHAPRRVPLDPTLAAEAESRDGLTVLRGNGPLTAAVIRTGLRSSLQVSLIRRDVFDRVRMRTDLRNGEDRFFVIRCLKSGVTFVRSPEVTVHYRLHAGHSSCAGAHDPEKVVQVYESIVRGYADLRSELPFTADEHAVLRRRLAREMFWNLGYNGHQQSGRTRTALALYRQALVLDPLRPKMWKTYLMTLARTGLTGGRR